MNRLTIVTLGTGGEAFLTRGVERALREAPRVVLRTGRHPMADFLRQEGVSFETLDALYDECEDFDTFNRAAAVKVLSLLNASPVCYAVSDAAFDETVARFSGSSPGRPRLRSCPASAMRPAAWLWWRMRRQASGCTRRSPSCNPASPRRSRCW